MSNPNPEYSTFTLDLKRIAEKSVRYEIIPWTDKEVIGISVLKNYPKKSLYKPVLFRNGKQDSVALIKIGYWIKDIKNDIAQLEISVTNASRYRFNHFEYDYDDTESPTEESIGISEKSRQPTGIEDITRFEYHITNKTRKFFDRKKNKYISFGLMVDTMYDLHLKTLTNFKFLLLTRIKNLAIKSIEPINKFLVYINFNFFGKKIKKGNNINDYAKGTLSTYKHEDLEDSAQDSDKLKILGSDFPISPQSARTFVLIFAILFFNNYLLNNDFTGLISLIESTKGNNFFLLIITSFLLYIVDRLLPFFILYILNVLIKLRLKLYDLKISID